MRTALRITGLTVLLAACALPAATAQESTLPPGATETQEPAEAPESTEATRIVERRSPDGATVLEVQGATVDEIFTQNGEVIIYFRDQITPQDIDTFAADRAGWIETIEYGYDSLVIRFAPHIEFSAAAPDGLATVRLRRVAAAPSGTGGAAAAQAEDVSQRDRLDYYRAYTLMETGAVRQGRAMLVKLHRADPRNVEVIVLLAQAEERLGRPRQAIAHYDRALDLDPNLPAVIRDLGRLHRQVADTARLNNRVQNVDETGETQVISTLDGQMTFGQGFSLEYDLENRYLDTRDVIRVNGDSGPFSDSRQRAAFTLRSPETGFGRFAASLFASNEVVGFGVEAELREGPESWHAEALWSEPDFTYVEGIVDGGARNRLAVTWRRQLGDLYDLSAGTSFNGYTLDGDYAGSGFGITAEIRRVIAAPIPFATIGYRLDAEYMLNTQTNEITGGPLLPLRSREAHTFDASVEGYLTDFLRGRAYAGYTFDRLNSGGPLAEGSLIYEPLADLEIIANLGTSLTEDRGTDNHLIYGGLSIRLRF